MRATSAPRRPARTVILKAKWDAIKGLRVMWRKRKEIQARRVVSAWEIRKMMEKGWPLRGR